MNINRYNWNELITEQDRNNICADVKSSIDAGQFWTNSPKYQTNFDVFGIPTVSYTHLTLPTNREV